MSLRIRSDTQIDTMHREKIVQTAPENFSQEVMIRFLCFFISVLLTYDMLTRLLI